MSAPGYPLVPHAARTGQDPAWLRRIVEVVNRSVTGRLNVTHSVTFGAGVDSTTLVDSRIHFWSHLNLVPLTADAASLEGQGWYVSSQTNGSAVITHANSSLADRTYSVLIIG